MASVFLSYVRADVDRAQSIAQALEKAGHSVWWDRHITGGAQYSKEIEQALKRAEAVVVLWSEHSVDSAWVRDEAAAGRDSGRLVPARLDQAEPPLGFRQYQTIDLSKGGRRANTPQFQTLLHAVQALSKVGRPAAIVTAEATGRHSLGRWPLVVAALALLTIAALVVLWRGQGPKSSVPVVEVAAADSSPGSRALARDLLVKLGTLQSAKADALQLTEQQPTGNADLSFAVGRSSQGQFARANLVLFDGRTRALLWSKDFELPIAQQADLQQQVAFTAGRALKCALEALGGGGKALDQPVLKLYLNGCAAIDEIAYRDLRLLIPTFLQVTAKAPAFEGGWAKLIQAEVLSAVNSYPRDAALLAVLKQHIAQARKVNPDLAEAYLAEVELVAPMNHVERLRLVDLAAERNPTHPEPLAASAYYLRFVGRMNEAVDNARRASELEPLAPSIRNDYIAALAYAGQFDRARHELERAEQLWPGASAVRDSRFLIELRFGDPKEALRLSRLGASSRTPQLDESFLRARIDPTHDNIEVAVQQARSLFDRESATLGTLVQTLGAFDREEELLSLLLDPRKTIKVTGQLFHPTLRELRHDPRFMLVAKRLGLLAYWQKSGKWPDFCFEPDLAYDCKAEASKLGT